MQSTLYYCSERGFSINLHHISANYATAGNKKILRDPPKIPHFLLLFLRMGVQWGEKKKNLNIIMMKGA